jgi:EmrB/QacA subfamily drug resistance transporter
MTGVLQRLRQVEYKYFVAAAFVFGAFMEILDTTIVNVALPTLGNEFHATTSSLEWVVTGYLLSLAVWIPASGWIGDRFGTKRTFLFATLMFIVGSALCGRAWSVGSLAFFRVVQGIGGGMMTPVGTAMMFRAFTIRERARASAYLAVPTQIAPMLGPLFGGFLVTNVNWRWIFYVNVPIGILSFLFSLVVLQEHREANAGRFDPAGFVLSGAGLAGVLFALSQGPEAGWTSPHVLLTGLGGIACFTALVFVERWVKAPMLDLNLFRTKMFAQGNVIAFSLFAAQNGVLFLLPLYLQDLRGLSALQSGLVTFVQPMATMSLAQFTSRMYLKLGPRKNLMACTFGIMTTSILLAFVTLTTNLWLIRGIMLVRGASGAFMMVSAQTTAFSNVTRERMGRASSLFNVQRQSAASFGVAVLATVLVTRTQALTSAGAAAASLAQRGSLTAFHDAFAGAAIIAFIGFLFAMRVKDEDVLGEKRIDAVGSAGQPAIAVQPERVSASTAG